VSCPVQNRPKSGATHWSVHDAAAESGISKTSVHRYFQLFGLQPHRTKSFKLSTDPCYNKDRKPFTWTATADSILQKLERLTSRISGTGH
jgi:AraC-like DNA-binding protein